MIAMSAGSSSPNTYLYPDLVKAGSLVEALRLVSRTVSGVEVDSIKAPRGNSIEASIDTSRGTIQINLGSEERFFSLQLFKDDDFLASGAAESLYDVISLAKALNDGLPLGELCVRFPFVELDELALPRERGEVVEAQWKMLLSDLEYIDLEELILTAYGEVEMRALLAYVYHSELRLVRGDKFRAPVLLSIKKLNDGDYAVATAPKIDEFGPKSSLIDAVRRAAALVRKAKDMGATGLV